MLTANENEIQDSYLNISVILIFPDESSAYIRLTQALAEEWVQG